MAQKDTDVLLAYFPEKGEGFPWTDPALPVAGEPLLLTIKVLKDPNVWLKAGTKGGISLDLAELFDPNHEILVDTGGHDRDWNTKVLDSTIRVYPDEKSCVEGEGLTITVSGRATKASEDAEFVLTEISASSEEGTPEPRTKNVPLHLEKPDTVFTDFRPQPASDSLINRETKLHLGWNAVLPDYRKKNEAGSENYYTLTLEYDGSQEDVTSWDSIELPPLSHSTTYLLTLRLFNNTDNHVLGTYRLATLVQVRNSDVTAGTLSVRNAVRALAGPQRLENEKQTRIASTDGFLRCTVRGPSGTLKITVDTKDYFLASNDRGVRDNSTNILIPVSKSTSFTLSPGSGSNYEAIWHPLGAGPGLN